LHTSSPSQQWYRTLDRLHACKEEDTEHTLFLTLPDLAAPRHVVYDLTSIQVRGVALPNLGAHAHRSDGEHAAVRCWWGSL
jgi:hypothetical protein